MDSLSTPSFSNPYAGIGVAGADYAETGWAGLSLVCVLQVRMGQAGLREVVGQRPNAVVPYLLPKLCAPPIKLSHARALEAVAGVAGGALQQCDRNWIYRSAPLGHSMG